MINSSIRYAQIGLVGLSTALMLWGCSDDGNSPQTSTPVNELETTENDGVFTTTARTAGDRAVYLDLESSDAIEIGDPRASLDWDLSFHGVEVRVNGGISGRGGVRVAIAEETNFDAIETAPSAPEYHSDNDDQPSDDDDDPDLAFWLEDRWYEGDAAAGNVEPRDRIYIVKSVEDNYFKLQFTDYETHNNQGSPTFRWSPIAPPDGSDVDPNEGLGEGLILEANRGWTYLDTNTGQLLESEDPRAENTWSIAVNRFMIQTNSGTSGEGFGGAQIAPPDAGTFGQIRSAPTVGYETDVVLDIPGHPGAGEFSGNPHLSNWYNYDVDTHELSTKTEVYWVRTGLGDYAKLRVTGYRDGRMSVEFERVMRRVDTHTRIVNVAEDSWTYLSLRHNKILETEDAAETLDWDLAFQGTTIRTNGGTSGAGQGAAMITEAEQLDDIQDIPNLAFVEDQEDADLSANPELREAWLEGEELPTPSGRIFIVRTADGHYAKVQITERGEDNLTIDWAYAGAGQDSF